MAEKIQSFRDLKVWQKAMDLAVMVYRIGQSMPASERYGLVQQMTRASASVAANIAEGNARGTTRDYAYFITVARGSLVETETYLTLTIRVDLVTESAAAPALALIREIDRMLFMLRRNLLARDESVSNPTEPEGPVDL